MSEEGTPKKKLPKVIKSLPKLGLFARVVVEKLTQEEIDKWTRRAAPESESSISVQNESSEEEDPILRKRRRVTYIDSSGSSSSDFATSDSSDGEGRGFSARNTRHFGRRRRRKEEKEVVSNKEERQRVQPVRSAKRNPVIIYTDESEEDDSANLIPINSRQSRQTSLKSVHFASDFPESSNGKDEALASPSGTVSAALSSKTTADSAPTISNIDSSCLLPSTSKETRNTSTGPRIIVATTSNVIRKSKGSSGSISGPKSSAAKTSNDSRNIDLGLKRSMVNTLNEIRSMKRSLKTSKNVVSDSSLSNNLSDNNFDGNVEPDPISKLVNLRSELISSGHVHPMNPTGLNRYEHNSSGYFHPTSKIDVVSFHESPSPSSSGNIYDLPTAVSSNEPVRIVSADDNIDALDKFTVVNNDLSNVGKIRLRSLQSLGASENFIKEANLKQGSHMEKMVQNLYSSHVSSVTNGLLNDIAENLKEKLSSTEEFNRILKEMQYQNKSKPEEMVNEQLETIVKKRQEYDANICKLFTEVVESFYTKLGQRKELENFPTLMYLGFLYILNFFIKITKNRYKKSSLFKNVVLVFTESLRNGHFKYDNIIHFFLSNNFHAHCFKLIEHIGSIQSQKNLSLLKSNEEPDSNEKELRAVPVRKISYKMMDSRMVIEYSKTLEEVETEGAAGNDSFKKSNTDSFPSPKFVQSKPMAVYPSPSSSNSQPKSVIVSSKSDKNNAVINKETQNSSVANAHVYSWESVIQSLKAPHLPDDTLNSLDNISLTDLLHASKSSFNDINPSSFPLNEQTSVIHSPQQVSVSHLAMPKPSNTVSLSSNQDNVIHSVNAVSSAPVTANVTNSVFLTQRRSTLGNGKNSKVQIVRPILKAKQSTRPSLNPVNQLNSVIPQSNPLLSPKVSSLNENTIERGKSHGISSRNGPPMATPILVKRPIAPSVVQNIAVSNPPAFSEAVLNRVDTSYQTSASSSLREALLADTAKKNSNMLADQQLNNQNSYDAPSVVAQKSSTNLSNCQPTNVYQPKVQNQYQYIAPNQNLVSNQVSSSTFYGLPVDGMVSPLNPCSNNQEVQPLYQAQHNQTMVSGTSVLYSDNSNPNFNSDLGPNSSVLYGNNQLNSQPLYYNNNITSSPMILCDMPPNAGNQENNAMYFNYTQPVPVNQTHSQLPGSPHAQSAQLNQMQTQSAPLNPVLTQSLNQFRPTTADASQYYSTPTTTIHWVSQPPSFTTPSLVQSFPNQMQYQHFQPNQGNNL